MLQDLNQSKKRDEILLLARSQHKHLLQYGLPLLQQLVLVTFGDKELEQMDCVIWNGSDLGPIMKGCGCEKSWFGSAFKVTNVRKRAWASACGH